jgi:fructoselysine-6-P-deglycase FrlB-like protein
MSAIAQEIASQPSCWRRAIDVARAHRASLPAPNDHLAVVGCGTSLFVARAFAGLRESAGHGVTDAYPASEFPVGRRYDHVLAISRSGTTTEVLDLLEGMEGRPSSGITAVDDAPLAAVVDAMIPLPFADERSIVQTRFATTALALLRVHVGGDLEPVLADAESALGEALPVDPSAFDHFVFLGHGWSVGLAEEAALKLREAARVHSEAYPAMEYRHGPISLAGPRSLVWILDSPDRAVASDIRATGATVRERELDPMAELVLVHRLAVARAEQLGLDPDHPRHLSRSVVLHASAPEPDGTTVAYARARGKEP